MGCLIWIGLVYLLGVTVAWPVDYRQQDDSDYPPTYGRDNGDIGDWMPEEEQEAENILPSLTLGELKELMEMAAKNTNELPVATFSPVGPDPTNNGGQGPFKFVKLTPPPVVQTRSPPPMKKHIATISDETPLYLNYAEKEDGVPHRPVGLQVLSGQEEPTKFVAEPADKPLVLLPEVKSQSKILTMLAEEEASRSQAEQVEQEATETDRIAGEDSQENGIPNRPEIDFTQRLAFPDFSGADVEPARLTAAEEAAEVQESPEEETGEEKGDAQDEVSSQVEEVNDTEEEADQDETTSSETPALPPSAVATSTDIATDPMVVHVVSAPAPSHLAQPNDISFIPSPEYSFFLKTVGEKRAQEPNADTANGSSSSLVVTIVGACVGSALAACVGAALLHRRNSRKQTLSDAEEPAYGVTGPGPIKPTFLDLSGDRSLAKSAETYHYQHQKKQLLSSVENNPSSGGSTATPRSGDHSDYDSDEDEEEGEDYGDYTVYECPGLAPPGEIEVLNPMFTGSPSSKDTAANDE